MEVYHLGHSKFAYLLNGEGAKLHGGRWNKIGTACLYTSDSKALCVLEYAANVRLQELPLSLSITEYEIPEGSWLTVSNKELPTNWQLVPTPEETKLLGTQLLQDKNVLAIKVPSVIIPTEYNFILNPLAKQFGKVRILNVKPFAMDKRIKH